MTKVCRCGCGVVGGVVIVLTWMLNVDVDVQDQCMCMSCEEQNTLHLFCNTSNENSNPVSADLADPMEIIQ